MKRPEIALIALALTTFACEKEARQAADAAPRGPASPACAPIAMTKVNARCVPYLTKMHPGTVTLLRTQAELDALYADANRDMPDPACKAAPRLTVDWAQHSLVIVETGGVCYVDSTATACRAPDGIHVESNVVSIGDCERAVVVKDVYTVPAVAAGVPVQGSFKASKRAR